MKKKYHPIRCTSKIKLSNRFEILRNFQDNPSQSYQSTHSFQMGQIKEVKTKHHNRVKGRVLNCIKYLFENTYQNVDTEASKMKKLNKKVKKLKSFMKFETYNPYSVLKDNSEEQIEDICTRIKIMKMKKVTLKKCRYCNRKKNQVRFRKIWQLRIAKKI